VAERGEAGDRDLEALARLDEVTRRLRRECPWDREQDERSIVPHTIEEAYELADAAARGDDAKLVDELGDVLFQVVFLALLLEERRAGDLAAVAGEITAKLIRRHPHVFGDEAGAESVAAIEPGPESSGDVLRNWDRIKRDVEGRGGDEDDPFADIPRNLPALLYARKVLRRVDPQGGGAAPRGEDRDAAEAEVGQLLLKAVETSRELGVDPELALRAAADRLRPGRG